MKKFFQGMICALLAVVLLFTATPYALRACTPPYNSALGNRSDDQKIKGLYLLKQSAQLPDEMVIYGSSELRTDYISTHPANFFAGKRCDFQVNLVGRGSCQSIIHAMSIAASGNSLEKTPVVLITSPQSYVAGGIEPDMFFANFSRQQYLTLLYDGTVSTEIKRQFSRRICKLFKQYDEKFGRLSGYDDVRLLAAACADGKTGGLYKTAAAPLYLFERLLCDWKDMAQSAQLISSVKTEKTPDLSGSIDWAAEETAAQQAAVLETVGNGFGMRSSDWKKNVGNHPERFQNRDASLSYTESVEYDDLRLLLEVCREKGIRPLFVSVPLHGTWSDYTGFSQQRRQEYYRKVNSIVFEYDVELLDLSEYEYEPYFLCDTMHLGWKGWLKVDEALIEFYQKTNSIRLSK